MDTREGVARQQSLVALGRANSVRAARAADKERIRRNALDLAAIVLKPPGHWSGAAVIDVLMLLRGVGSSKAASMCANVPVSETRRLSDLTFRQRYALAVMICGGDREHVPAAIPDDLHQSLDDSGALCAQAEQATRQAMRLVARSGRLLEDRHPH